MNEPTFPPLQPKVVLGVAAHPDDLDFGAGGTIATFAGQGADIYYLVLTDGGKGTKDRAMTPEALRDLRRVEQRKAGTVLGVKDVFFCDYPDGALENTQDVKRDVVKVIRRVRPDVVVAIDPSVLYSVELGLVNHPDHRAAGQAALDAVYPLARDHMAFPELLDQGLEPHNTKTLLLFRFDTKRTAFAVDISDTFDQKLQALAAHASQFGDMEGIRSLALRVASQAGEAHGCKYAEQFVRIDID